MSKVEQAAGKWRVTVWTEGSPLWPKLQFEDGEEIRAGPGVSDLHDLRYCIDRVLARLPGVVT